MPAFDILSDVPDQPLVIRDVGPWDRYPTITNGIEDVVTQLYHLGRLRPGRRFLYVDSDGILTEALHAEGRFTGYRHPIREEAKSK
jgi:hypothetical protein